MPARSKKIKVEKEDETCNVLNETEDTLATVEQPHLSPTEAATDNIQPVDTTSTPVAGPSSDDQETVKTSGGRTVTSPSKNTTHVPVTWTAGENKKLLKAIKKYGQNDYINLAIYIKTKNPHQVEHHVKRMLARKARMNHVSGASKAPIETWLQTIDDKVPSDADYSGILARIMSIAGNFEPHDNLKASKRTPNYANIYKYIAALMSGDAPTLLSAVEAAIVLELLQDLSDRLKALDTSKQRDFMLEKFFEFQANKKAAKPETKSRDGSGDTVTGQTTAATDESAATQQEAVTQSQAEKRPALFSINPFAIPVKLLKLERTAATDKSATTEAESE